MVMQIQASDVTHCFIATALFHVAKNDHTHQATLANDCYLTMLVISNRTRSTAGKYQNAHLKKDACKKT